ncbi:methyltransferase domain-containing protein [Saccharothrix sp.]|uniref:protein-L-isoaspartate O-methyltransferase family protein n=1 Tax=Saccharothrix sp. TaxID=1873460 RepID=UPI002810C8A3|nr:methyltransferase domain-containing protein [Saccharothrix sp.]
MAERLAGYARALRGLGAIRTDVVERAFRSVRRDLCVTHFYPAPGERVDVLPGGASDAVLDVVYQDVPLPVRRPGAGVADLCSAARPSVVARMVEALELLPGHRVLEIGSGNGYTAALIATITGTRVFSLDPRLDVVHDVQQAMRRLGRTDVTVACGDVDAGVPSQAPFDRVVVTFPVDRVSPAWLDQLSADGMLLVPMRLADSHPVLAVRVDHDGAFGTPALWTSPRDYDWSLAAEEFDGRKYPVAVPTRR